MTENASLENPSAKKQNLIIITHLQQTHLSTVSGPLLNYSRKHPPYVNLKFHSIFEAYAIRNIRTFMLKNTSFLSSKLGPEMPCSFKVMKFVRGVWRSCFLMKMCSGSYQMNFSSLYVAQDGHFLSVVMFYYSCHRTWQCKIYLEEKFHQLQNIKRILSP